MAYFMNKALSFLACGILMAAATASVARAATDRENYVVEVTSCEAILREFMAVPSTAIPPAVLRQAKGLLIVNQFKAGFIIGVKGGYGVMMVKRTDGKWSIPVLVRASEASIGLQAGADSIETIYVFTDAETPRMMYKQHFKIGVDAKAVAGPHATDIEKNGEPIVAAPILVYTNSTGLYAGAVLKAAQVSRDDKANFVLYNTTYTMPELLYSDWVTPPQEVLPLVNFVRQIAP
jgi:lipid-binding SYLF domain-containing protein